MCEESQSAACSKPGGSSATVQQTAAMAVDARLARPAQAEPSATRNQTLKSATASAPLSDPPLVRPLSSMHLRASRQQPAENLGLTRQLLPLYFPFRPSSYSSQPLSLQTTYLRLVGVHGLGETVDARRGETRVEVLLARLAALPLRCELCLGTLRRFGQST